ncbi:MAG: hypothetical protein PHQ75_04760, partial [Thermoguttaceae bacterium]|nr:hypothetical protein [Thermoguttaceae bacterium]
VFDNAATGNGGAIYNEGTLTMTGFSSKPVVFYGNMAAKGGAIYNTGTFTAKYVNSFNKDETDITKAGNLATQAGGFLYNATGASATINNSKIYYNYATTEETLADTNYTGQGGGIYNAGGLVLFASDLGGNRAASGGAVYDAATAGSANGYSTSVVNSVIRGNYAADNGGALYANSAPIYVYFSTIAGNRANNGGGVYVNSNTGAKLMLENSVVANNWWVTKSSDIYTADSQAVVASYSFVSIGDTQWNRESSVIGSMSTPVNPLFVAMSHDVVTDILGWKNWTLSSMSSQIVAKGNAKSEQSKLYYLSLTGKSITIAYDFTGLKNRRILSAEGVYVTDMGAYETGEQKETPSTKVTTLDYIYDQTDGLISLYEAILYATNPEYLRNFPSTCTTQITFDESLNGGTITVGNPFGDDDPNEVYSLVMDDSYEIYVANGQNITLKGNGTSVLSVQTGANVTVTGLNITGGSAEMGGAINMKAGSLVLQDLCIFGNEAQKDGGAIYLSGGKLALIDVLISENTASSDVTYQMDTMGGAIRGVGGTLEIYGCTITQNEAPNYGGLYISDTNLIVYNTIMTENTDGIGYSGDFYCKGMKNNIFHSLIGIMKDAYIINGVNGNLAGTSLYPVEADMTYTPWSVSAEGKYTTPVVSLNTTSPAINAGDNSRVLYAEGKRIEFDLFGNTRILAGTVDMGVAESGVLDPIGTVVTTLEDVVDPNDGLLSIREAIENAKDGDTVTFNISEEKLAENGGLYTIRLTGGAISLSGDKSITIDARENDDAQIQNGITIDAQSDSRVFSIGGTQNITLYNLVLTGGRAEVGGAIKSESSGQIELINCVVYDNVTEMEGPANRGGAIYLGAGTLKLLNSTVAANTTFSYGAIYAANSAKVILYNSIVSNNKNDIQDEDNNYDVFVASGNQSLEMVTSLVGSLPAAYAPSYLGNACVVGTFDAPADAGFVVKPAFAANSPYRVVNLDGPTDLYLSSTSRAVNAGTNTLVGQPGYSSEISTDYRTYNTTVLNCDLAGNDRILYYTVDMGAYECTEEVSVKPSTIVTTLDDLADNPFDEVTTLREAIKNAGSTYIDQDGKIVTLGTTVTFDPKLLGGTINLTQGAVVIDKTVSVDASDLTGGITINAGGTSRVFEVLATTSAVAGQSDEIGLMGLRLTGGYAEVTQTSTIGGGAIYHTGGNLTIINSLLYDNEALKGGAIQSDGGTLKLVNVTITKNNAHDVTLPAEEDTPETTIKGGYGAIYSVNGDITFENTLVALNTYNATKTDGQWDTQASLTAQGRFSVEIFANTKLFKSSLVGVMRTVESIHGDKNGNLSGDPYNPLDPVFVDWDSNNFSLGRDTQNINSPAINAGQSEYAFDLDGNTILTDLTGSHRFVQQIDMGAFETALGTKEIPSTIVTTTSDVVNDMDGLISLREAINYAGTVGLGSTVTFMKSLTGKTFYLDSQLFIDKTVTIDGESLGTDITITLSDSVKDQGVIYINNGTVEMLNLVITNRYTARAKSGQNLNIANGGGIYVRMGSLFLYNCLLYDNYATNGAAIYVNPEPETVNLNIINTTITDNRCYSTGSTYTGAAVQAGKGIVNIQNSIIAENQTAEAVKGTRILPQYSFLDYAPDVAKEEGHGMYGNYVGYDDIKEEMKKEAKKLFVDWANDDFHLTDASLATNSGKNTFTLFDNNGDISFYGLINASGVDLNGNRRLVGQTVDMGAYENQLAIDDYCWRDSADGYPIDEDSFNAMIEQSLTNSAAISRDVTALIATNPDADANDLLTTYRQQVATGKTAQSLLWYLRTYVQNYISSPTTGQAFDHLTFEQRVKIIDIYSETSYANEVISGHAAASVSVFRTWMNKWASGSDELALLDTLITSSSSTPLTTLLQLTSAAWDDSDLGKEKATLIEFIAPTGLPVADSLDDILAFTNKDVQTANYLRAFIQEYDAAPTNANKIIRNKMSGSVSRYEIYLYRLKDALEAVVGDDYSQAHKALGYLTIHGLDPDSRILVTTNLDTVTAQDGFISLREAVDRAERLYDIKISKPVEFATYSSVLTKNSTMVLGTQTISIERPITIDASMIDSFRINGNALNRIFMINTTAYPDEEVRLVNLELFNGYASSGGAIYHQGGNLVLINSLIHTNQAKYPSSAATTISYGGGIFSDAGCLTLVNCTVANNRADYGGGIYATPATTLFLYNTIIAKNAVNKAQSTTDVDIYVGSSSKLEMAYSFIGNCYSLAGRNETQGNIVGYGDDKSRDPYFVDINEGNFRLQPKIIRGDSSVDNPAAIGGNVAYVDYFNFVDDLDGHVIGYGDTEIQAERELQYLLDKGYDPDAGSAETRPYTELTETINDSRVNDMLGQRINVDITDQSATSLETLKAIYYDTSVPDSAISDKGGTIQMKDTSIVLLYYIALYKDNGEGQIPATTTVYTSKQSILYWFETRDYDTYNFNPDAENFNAATSSYTIGKDRYNSNYIDTLNASLNSVDKFLAFLEINKTRLINVAQITNLVNGLVDEAKNTGSPVTTVRNLSEAGWGKIGLGDQGGELYRDILATGATSLNELESFILEWNEENTVAQALKRRIDENSDDKNIADENKFVLNGTLYTRRLKDALLEIVNGPISMGAYQRTRETPSPIVTTAEDVVDPYDGLISLREAVLYATFSITEAVSTRENLEALSIGTRRTNRYNTYPDILTSGGAVPYTAVTTSLVGYQQSVSTNAFYSKEELIVNYWKITFADHLAGQTITLDSNLGAIDMYGFAKTFTTSSVFYYLIDASSINRLGGITIDANNINYIFNLHGYQNGA